MYRYSVLYDKLKSRLEVFRDVPLKQHTSFRIGGPARLLAFPKTEEELIYAVKAGREGNVPVLILGNGSNVLVKDAGVEALVIKTFEGYNKIYADGDEIVAEAGALLSKIAVLARDNGLTGAEFAHGIPGTLGGAVLMNAGAYGGEMKDIVVSVRYLDEHGEICETRECGFAYRKSRFAEGRDVILSARLKLKPGSKEEIQEKMSALSKKRREKQPLELPSAGSTFKRPEGHFAAALIEDAGLKGCRVGGACVSQKHSGFIVNDGNANAEDVLQLIEHVKNTVCDKFGVSLETEVKIIG